MATMRVRRRGGRTQRQLYPRGRRRLATKASIRGAQTDGRNKRDPTEFQQLMRIGARQAEEEKISTRGEAERRTDGTRSRTSIGRMKEWLFAAAQCTQTMTSPSSPSSAHSKLPLGGRHPSALFFRGVITPSSLLGRKRLASRPEPEPDRSSSSNSGFTAAEETAVAIKGIEAEAAAAPARYGHFQNLQRSRNTLARGFREQENSRMRSRTVVVSAVLTLFSP